MGVPDGAIARGRNVVVVLDHASLKGVVSASVARHGQDTITAVDYKQLGEVTNTARPSINNGVLMTLDHSQWIVAGTSYLTGLKLDKASKLAAPTGQKLVLKVNGREVPITAGSYRGAIEVGTVHAP